MRLLCTSTLEHLSVTAATIVEKYDAVGRSDERRTETCGAKQHENRFRWDFKAHRRSDRISGCGSHLARTTQWSLALPSDGGTLEFTAGTREIVEEFVYACNYWAARISKEPLVEAVSSLEFGWERPLELLNKSIQAERMKSNHEQS